MPANQQLPVSDIVLGPDRQTHQGFLESQEKSSGPTEPTGELIDELGELHAKPRFGEEFLAIAAGALDGNVRQQFLLAKVLEYCSFSSADPLAAQASFESLLSRTSMGQQPAQTVQTWLKQCNEVYRWAGENSASPVEWFAAAAEQGFAPAMFDLAFADTAMTMQDRRALLEQAILSADQFVLPMTAAYLSIVDSAHAAGHAGATRRWRYWMYAACELGLDCSADAKWFIELCKTTPCPPSATAREFLMSGASSEVDLLNASHTLVEQLRGGVVPAAVLEDLIPDGG